MLTRLLYGLDRQEFDQAVVSITDCGVHGEALKAAGIEVTALGMTGLLSLPRTLLRLRQVITSYRPHVIQTWLYHADFLGLLASRWAGDCSLVWSIRCAKLSIDDAPFSTHWMIRLLAKLSSLPTAVIFNSIAGKNSHKAIGYHPRSEMVISNGFDVETWKPVEFRRREFRAGIGVMDDVFLVGMIARHHPIKDHKCFFRAAAQIHSHRPDVHFVLVGSGITWNNTALVADIDECGIAGYVSLLGPRDDMPRVMSGLDCLVLTSTSEGFPNVIGEAMASGIPCVTTDAGDAGHIIADTGRVVPVGDVDGIAKGVLRLMEDTPRERLALALRCRARISENFEIESVLAHYASFYKELHEHSQ